jgi:hypothetical protein
MPGLCGSTDRYHFYIWCGMITGLTRLIRRLHCWNETRCGRAFSRQPYCGNFNGGGKPENEPFNLQQRCNFYNLEVMRYLLFFSSVCFVARAQDTGVPADPDALWSVFAQVKFTPQYYEKYKTYFLTPGFDSRIRIIEGKEITLRGHYIPYELSDRNSIIISRNPFSSCFFLRWCRT